MTLLNGSGPNAKIATITLNPAIDQIVVIPGFRPGHVNRVQSTQSGPGGKGVNVASILADLGCSVAVSGFLGEGNTGLFEKLFAEKRIEDCFVRIAGSTRTGIKILDPESDQTTDINFPGQSPGLKDIDALFRTVGDLTVSYEWFVVSGSVPAGAPADIYRRLIDLIRARGRSVSLDTSGEPLCEALQALPTLAKPNIDELGQWLGRPLRAEADVVRAGRSLLEEGIRYVVISMGDRGALFMEGDLVLWARPPRVRAVITTGAGDAMVSGAVLGCAREQPLAASARLATALAVDAVTHVGSGISSLSAVESWMQLVSVHELNGSGQWEPAEG